LLIFFKIIIVNIINELKYKTFFRKGDELPLSSIRRYVTEYVKKYELQDKTDPSYVFLLFLVLTTYFEDNLNNCIPKFF